MARFLTTENIQAYRAHKILYRKQALLTVMQNFKKKKSFYISLLKAYFTLFDKYVLTC